MKKIMIYTFCLIMIGVGFQSCKQSDEKIKDKVEEALKDEYSAISVSVRDKVVTLSGTLQSQAEKASAESIARSVKNVESVINDITVPQAAPVVRVTSDEDIQSAVKARLRSADYDDIEVQVVNGEVVLTGDLSRDNLENVMQIVNETDHVKKVTNNLTLK